MGVPYSVFCCEIAKLKALIAAGGGGGGGAAFATSAELAAILTDETGTAGFVVFSINPTIDGPKIINGIVDSAGNKVLDFAQVGSAVNAVQVINAAAGTGVTITATGSDANIDITIAALGTGKVRVATAPAGTNTTQIASTAFVTTALATQASSSIGLNLALISGNYLN